MPYYVVLEIADFNPRSREGSDFIRISALHLFSISIHAPAKGATSQAPARAEYKNFNPRSREGSDNINAPGKIIRTYFNPRSREGSDFANIIFYNIRKISIHAPAKGATLSSRVLYKVPEFQSTLPRRERPCKCFKYIGYTLISIHAPAKGATAFINIFSLTVRLFLFHLTNKI